MEYDKIEHRVRSVVGEVLRVPFEKMSLQSRFREDLGADSLDLATLLMALEDEFEDEITQEQEQQLLTIGSTVEFLKSKTSTTVSAA